METTLIVRIILIITSFLSIFLQIVGLVGRAWYGFSLSMDVQGVKVQEHMEGGLFHFSPLEVCVDPGNGTVCKTPDQFPPESRQLFDVANTAVHESFAILRFLTVTGLLLSVCGLTLLYIYLCRKANRHRCIGIVCAIAWILGALLEIVAAGIQLSRNNDTKNGFRIIEVALEKQKIQIQAKLITAWAVIVLGIGAAWAIIVGLLVAMTTCAKKFSKTVIIYRELKEKEKDNMMLDQDDDD